MKRYLLDTALLAGFMHKRPHAVSLITPWLNEHTVVTSTMVYAEVIEYLKGLRDFSEHYAAFHDLLHEIIPYRLTYPILDRYADLRRQMRQPYGKGLIGDMDTLIAATALESHLTVVTTDRDFERVPHLQWQLVNLKKAA